MGIAITAETCPQYLVLDESRYQLPGFESAKYVMSPPLRSLADQAALLEAVANGEIETLATDHCSYNFAGQKSLGSADFTKIPNGAPGIEHRVPLMFTRLVHGKLISSARLVALMAENPAKMYHLYPQKGLLAEGSDADIVIYQVAGSHPITAARQTQNVDYTPYEGMMVHGSVQHVLVNGVPVVENGVLTHPNQGTYAYSSLHEQA
jgi:dihydropyrimidinase